MILKATIEQTKFLLRRKEAICVFYILFFMVLANFIENVLDFQGFYIPEMYQPMKLLLLSYNMTNWNADGMLLLVQIYPLLVGGAAGFSLAREYQRETRVFLISRLGSSCYQVSKYLSIFLATMIIFTVPFLLEIVLNCVSFPLSATGDLSNLHFYSRQYRDNVQHYLMKELYLYSPYLYAVVGTFFFGVVSGILGVFTAAVSSLKKVKYMVFLCLPVFVGLNLLTILGSILPKEVPSVRWYDYVQLFNDRVKNVGGFVTALIVLVLFSICTVCIGGRRDCLS